MKFLDVTENKIENLFCEINYYSAINIGASIIINFSF
jgi:hypothetical protein